MTRAEVPDQLLRLRLERLRLRLRRRRRRRRRLSFEEEAFFRAEVRAGWSALKMLERAMVMTFLLDVPR